MSQQTLSLSLTEFGGLVREFLLVVDYGQDYFDCAVRFIEQLGMSKFYKADLGFVEQGGTITPWLTEYELFDLPY